jgi:hypothetical protein
MKYESENQTFIAMELLEGSTLKHLISGQPMEIDTVLVDKSNLQTYREALAAHPKPL